MDNDILNNSSDRPSNYDFAPSDKGQAIVRLVIVSVIVVLSIYHYAPNTVANFGDHPLLGLAIFYWLYSALFFAWTLVLEGRDANSRHAVIKRLIGVFTDIAACSIYTGMADLNSIIVYPIYITTIIGNGYRYGLKYLYLSIFISVVGFSIALAYNPLIAGKFNLIVAYYVGLIFVPLYSAALLRRYRDVLAHLKEVNEARSRFIANMSHELRTPLHAIISITDILNEEITKPKLIEQDPGAKLRMVNESAQHLLMLVNRVLDTASSEAGMAKLEEPESIDLYRTIHTAIDICRPKALEKEVEFHWYIDTSVPQYVVSSKQHIQEILVNTIGNAVKYTDTGYVYLRVTVANASVELDEVVVKFEIIDTGIGISEKVLPTIFEPFTLGDDSTARWHTGSGLGLTITKQYVGLLKGHISLNSKENIGTTCHVILPLLVQNVDRVPTPSSYKCVLVTPRTLSEEELSAFQKAKIEVQATGSRRRTEDAIDADRATLILIDAEFGDQCESITRGIKEYRPNSIFVLYGGEVNFSSSSPIAFVTCVSRGNSSELCRMREIVVIPDVTEQSELEVASLPLRVLVADDNVINLKTARMALESVGHRVFTVKNGEEALDELENGVYDILIIDMHMPGMSGIDAVKLYNYMMPEDPVPIIMITADATAEAREDAERAGIAAFLTKPARPAELRKVVQQHARKPQNRALSTSYAIDNSRIVAIEDALIDPSEMGQLIDCNANKSKGETQALLLELIEEFEIDALALIDEACTAAKNSLPSLVYSSMHTLNGTAAILGAVAIQRRAAALEKCSISDILATMLREAKDLRGLVQRSRLALSNLIEKQIRSSIRAAN